MADKYVSTNMDNGVQVKEALERINAYHPDLFAWSEISNSVTVNLKSPTSYSGIKDPGDYVIYKFSNGPSKIPSTLSPILLSLRNGKKYVSANGVVYTLDSSGNNWIDINDSVDDDTIIYVRSDTAPTRTNNTFWFDTSNYDGTSDGYIELKYYDTDTNSWASVFNETNYLKKSTLDPTGKNTDIYAYITNQIANVLGDYGEFIKHKANQLTLIHVTADDRAQYAKIITEAELRDLINNTYKSAIEKIIDDSVSAELDTTQLDSDATSLENSYKSHLGNHITADNIASWRNKADANHTHDYTSGDVKIQGSQVVSGIFTDDQLPDEIKERYYKLTDTAENTFSNTSITDADRKSKYHNGNAFYYETTDDTTGETVRKWYRIIDSSKVGTSSWADGVVDFTGKKANMDWNNVTGRPTTLEEFGITNTLYTKTEVDEKFKVYNDQVTSMNKTLAECEKDTGYEYGNKPVWTEGAISNTSRYWYSVCYGNDKFVAVGYNYDSEYKLISGNDVAYSIDGMNWAEGTISSTGRDWMPVCYGNGKFVTVAYDSNYFAYSTDGINWTEGTMPTSRNWNSVCYGNGKFIALNYNSNYFAYSTDGITWAEGTISDTSRNWVSVCYGNGKFVAVANNTNYFAYSIDGMNWTEGTISSTSRLWESVCYGNDKFVAVAWTGNYFAYSTDGINWTEGTIPNRNWNSVCYGNGKFVAVAGNYNYFAYSTDGINWTEGTMPTSRNWNSVCYGNGKFIALNYNSNYFAYSTDGITWAEGTISDTSRNWVSVCYGNDKFVITPYSTNYFAYSTDGINWTEGTISSTSKQWYSICYGNDKYVSVTWNSNYSASITFSPTGLIQYAAPAKDLTWENITNKPSTLAEYNITDCYTKDEINALYNTIIENLNSIKTKATDLSNQITVDIPSDLDTTIETNTTTVNELNNKLDILIKNASLDDALKNQILSLVENDMIGSMNVTMTKTINIAYSWDIDSNGPGLSSTFKIPTGTSYTIDLNNPIEDIYTVDETYTSGMTDEHGDTGYYEFSGWSY